MISEPVEQLNQHAWIIVLIIMQILEFYPKANFEIFSLKIKT
jgi:hypothetical protein